MLLIALIPFILLEVFVSLKTGSSIGFWLSALWVIASMFVGVYLLKRFVFFFEESTYSLAFGYLHAGTLQKASALYLAGAVLVFLPGVLSDLVGVLMVCYAFYLRSKGTMERSKHFEKNNPRGEDDVIDVEIIEHGEYRNT